MTVPPAASSETTAEGALAETISEVRRIEASASGGRSVSDSQLVEVAMPSIPPAVVVPPLNLNSPASDIGAQILADAVQNARAEQSSTTPCKVTLEDLFF